MPVTHIDSYGGLRIDGKAQVVDLEGNLDPGPLCRRRSQRRRPPARHRPRLGRRASLRRRTPSKSRASDCHRHASGGATLPPPRSRTRAPCIRADSCGELLPAAADRSAGLSRSPACRCPPSRRTRQFERRPSRAARGIARRCRRRSARAGQAHLERRRLFQLPRHQRPRAVTAPIFPPGRTSAPPGSTRSTMLQMVECGIAGTRDARLAQGRLHRPSPATAIRSDPPPAGTSSAGPTPSIS